MRLAKELKDARDTQNEAVYTSKHLELSKRAKTINSKVSKIFLNRDILSMLVDVMELHRSFDEGPSHPMPLLQVNFLYKNFIGIHGWVSVNLNVQLMDLEVEFE
jgi:hypothetical protein